MVTCDDQNCLFMSKLHSKRSGFCPGILRVACNWEASYRTLQLTHSLFALWFFLLRPGSTDTAQALEYAFGLVRDGVHSHRLGADLVQAILHCLYEAFPGLMWSILIDATMHVNKNGFNVIGLFGDALRVDAGDTNELQEVEHCRLGQALQVESAFVVTICW